MAIIKLIRYELFFTTAMLLLASLSNGQNKTLLSLSVICQKKQNEKVVFYLKIVNHSAETVEMPNRIVSGSYKEGIVNLGFEILRISKLDTLDILKTHLQDLHAPNLPYDNKYELQPGKQRCIKVPIDNFFFDEKGNYIIRFILKKELLFEKSLKIQSDIFSRWVNLTIN